MQCKVEGCAGAAHYKAAQLCAMHYHRQRRRGSFDVKQARPRYEDEHGYQFVRSPGHPLCAKGQSYVAEQRLVLYAAIGPGPMQCDLCGCALTWKTCQADHIDENPRNNDRDNLRPLCRRCNVWRSMPPAHARIPNATVLTWAGETKTAFEWSKDVRVSLSAGAIRARKRKGMSDEDCLFAPKITHNGKPFKNGRTTATYRQKLRDLQRGTNGEAP